MDSSRGEGDRRHGGKKGCDGDGVELDVAGE